MFELPVDVSTNGSTCKNTSSTLKLNFGPGHSWSVNFTANGKMYHADTITLSYNLSDATIFPNSASNGNSHTSKVQTHMGERPFTGVYAVLGFLSDTKVVTAETQITNVGIDTCYSCRSVDTIAGKSVNQTLWNVLIQAFVSNNSTSENSECRCSMAARPAFLPRSL